MVSRSGPNWLLGTLIVLSLGVHAVLLIHLSGIYRAGALTYIEMTLQNIHRTQTRDIPRPRPRPEAPAPGAPVPKLNVAQRPLPRLKPLTPAAAPDTAPSPLGERIGVPAIPRPPAVAASDWVPKFQAEAAPTEFMTADSYLEMVKLRIESRKRYPRAAKNARIEGRVAIRFILAADGSVREVEIVKGSYSNELNRAALEAVRHAAPFPRPPANLFQEDIVLKLNIIFELT
jgi:periplasmic protein TonB